MADDKKYYYLKLKDNFFDSDEMIVLESAPDGYLYSNILLKIYLRSLKNNGKLMFNDFIPYDSFILSKIVRHPVGVVEKAINTFKQLGLIEIMDNGAIYITNIQSFIGQSSTEADRKRLYRDRIELEKQSTLLIEDKCPDKRTPEIELEKEIELELDTEKEIDKDLNSNSKLRANKPKKIDIDQLLCASGYGDDVLQYISDYIDMRKSIKKPMSSGAVKHFLNALKRLPDQRPAYLMKALEISILRNYLSVFPIANERDLPPEEKIAYVEERDPNENISWFDPRFDPNACCRKTSVGTST